MVIIVLVLHEGKVLSCVQKGRNDSAKVWFLSFLLPMIPREPPETKDCDRETVRILGTGGSLILTEE